MVPTPHEVYYMKDGVTFLVEDTLFRVPRYMLENASPVLAGMLSRVDADGGPLALSKVTSAEFERLLAFLYPLTPQVPAVMQAWDEEQWTAILRLATIWEMGSIRATAMRLLSQTPSPFTKIALGRAYGHAPWVRDGFAVLCLRAEPLRADECVQLTKDDVIACAAAREEIRRRVGLPKGRSSGVDLVLPSRQARPSEAGTQISEYQHLSHDRTVRRIVNSAFGFDSEEEQEDGSADTGGDKTLWWPLQSMTAPRALGLGPTLDGTDGQWRSNIQNLKGLLNSAAASMLWVVELERYWPCDVLLKEFLEYFSPLSLSAIALSIGFLFLISQVMSTA